MVSRFLQQLREKNPTGASTESLTQVAVSLPGVQEKLGVMNKGLVYALWDYTAQQPDELSFREGDALTVLRRRDDSETEWWWARLNDREGYVPRNLLGVREHEIKIKN